MVKKMKPNQRSFRAMLTDRGDLAEKYCDHGSDFVARTMSLITSCRLQAKMLLRSAHRF